MEEPYHNNQFCNCPNAVSVVANYFHKPLTPAWKFQKIPLVGKTYQQIGENYAVGAARLGYSIYPGGFLLVNFQHKHKLLLYFHNIKILMIMIEYYM
ncbi:hypothetical protein [Spiroplasma endosymbiont of Notiophilus biguttatus]|uniref:hypothetical protein n=1 Tax=Spiroplasma endosymbiont of Notiophilus biguttatus TaxID=3066285 RepID=UPI00313D4AD5